MKRAYIAHPLRGLDQKNGTNNDKNRQKVTEICREIANFENEYAVIPVSPLHAFSYLDDFDQDKVLEFCFELLDSCSELWVFGSWWQSMGVMKEISHALDGGKKTFIYGDGPNSGRVEISSYKDLCCFLQGYIYRTSQTAAVEAEPAEAMPEW